MSSFYAVKLPIKCQLLGQPSARFMLSQVKVYWVSVVIFSSNKRQKNKKIKRNSGFINESHLKVFQKNIYH